MRASSHLGAVRATIAQLEAVSGPVKGRIYPIETSEMTIGRDPKNEIPLLDGAVSRHHCRISSLPGGAYSIADLDSRNHTYVNDQQIAERLLAEFDRIRVGASTFVFVPNPLPAEVSTGEPHDGDRTVILRPDEALSKLQNNPAAIRDLKTLIEFGQTINTHRDLADLQQQTLESLLGVIPADRAAVLLFGDGGETSSAGIERNGKASEDVPFSKTIVAAVKLTGHAILANKTQDEDSFDESLSLARRKVTSVLAVPLDTAGGRIGAIYLDCATPGVAFSEHHLQLLTALGNITALAIQNVRRLDAMESENTRLREELNIRHDMVGESAAMREMHQFIGRVAPSDSTVLVWGESGTGKELVARAIHNNSTRADKPFVAINCAAITDSLLESELFGHEKGAFTGASAQKKGKLELANTGTVFLDEIGELAPLLQAKLLRVLQEREIERVGGTKPIKIDIRLVAATNRDLKEMTKANTFRLDLYYRLNVVSIRTRPLRERRDDIAALAEHFLAKHSQRVNRRVNSISPKARACLMQYGWPGNVRELENAIERAVVLGSSDRILPEDLPDSVIDEAVAMSDEGVTPLHDALRDAKKKIILEAIAQAGGNQTEAARQLGVHPNHLFRTIRQLDIRPKK